MADIRTRGNVKWDENVRVGSVTTQDLESFIQTKFDAIVQMINDDIDKKGENHPKMQKADIILFTVNPYTDGVPGKNKRFFPLLLMMPLSVLKGGRKDRNCNELAIFNPMNADHAIKIKDPFYKLISSFMYSKDDEKAFFSAEWRHTMHIDAAVSAKLKFWRLPKIDKFGKGNLEEFVVVLIDPIRLIHNYNENVDASHDDPSNKFKINITDVNQISSSNFKYSIERVLVKRNKKKNGSSSDKISYEINQRVRRNGYNK